MSKPVPAPAPPQAKLGLTVGVVTPTDVGRLLHELEIIDNAMLQLSVRNPGKSVALPAISKSMERFAELNKLNLALPTDRQALKAFLTKVQKRQQILHISFSSSPTPAFLEKLVVWIRREIGPLVLLTIGLQPSIGAGCMVRSTNKYFDLSLSQTFYNKRPLLLEQIIPAANEAPVEVPGGVRFEAPVQ